MGRLDLQPLPDEHLQALSRPREGIAFWHIRRVVGHACAQGMSAGLNIAALSRRTGVAPDTLRKWEQRYHILDPTRTSGGQRRYSERDVARVEWLCERMREGYRISEASSLLGSLEIAPTRSPQDHLAALLEAEPETIGLLVDQAFALHGVDATFDEILTPLLQAVGDRWERGEITVAQEHFVSETVRSRLGHLLADAGGGVRGVAVLACAPGEQHELGLMMVAIALRRDGWKVFYLGANTPLADAIDLARRESANVLGISVTTAELQDIPHVDGVEVILGGRGTGGQAGDLAGTVSAVRAFAA
jgi:DNA-binding transcriptional MerR regulator